jgi:hypothetical protein
MKYLIERPFVTVIGKPFRLQGARGDPEATTEEASVGEMLFWLLGAYTPQIVHPPLVVADLRKLNRLLDLFERAPEEGYYAIEDSDIEILLRVAPQMASRISPRNAPLIEDVIREMSKEKPKLDIKRQTESAV